MTCIHCRNDIADYSNFCSFCGAQQRVSDGQSRPSKRLRRSATDRKIAGVCGGIAEYFEADSTVVRLIWVLAVILPIPLVPAFLGYIVAWVAMPKAPLPITGMTPPPVVIPNSTHAGA